MSVVDPLSQVTSCSTRCAGRRNRTRIRPRLAVVRVVGGPGARCVVELDVVADQAALRIIVPPGLGPRLAAVRVDRAPGAVGIVIVELDAGRAGLGIVAVKQVPSISLALLTS